MFSFWENPTEKAQHKCVDVVPFTLERRANENYKTTLLKLLSI